MAETRREAHEKPLTLAQKRILRGYLAYMRMIIYESQEFDRKHFVPSTSAFDERRKSASVSRETSTQDTLYGNFSHRAWKPLNKWFQLEES
jgi:hypothetical protein